MRNFMKKVIKTLFVITMLIGVLQLPSMRIGKVSADAGDVPVHDKVVDDNGDGTYNIELSVKGDADTTTQRVGSVNVVIIYDTSSSMTN